MYPLITDSAEADIAGAKTVHRMLLPITDIQALAQQGDETPICGDTLAFYSLNRPPRQDLVPATP